MHFLSKLIVIKRENLYIISLISEIVGLENGMIIVCLIKNEGYMGARGEKIQSVLNRLNGTKTQDLYFKNAYVPYISYWYDEPTDLLMTQYVAVKITHTTEDIDIAVIDDYLSQLEDKLMEYFKKNFNIELLSYDCDD